MKKTLLTAIAVAATMSMSAAVPTFTVRDGINSPITQTAVTYSNPCAYDDNNNAYIAGRFKGEFTFGSSTVKSDDEGAYLVKYDMNMQPVWAVAVSGLASITCVTTDAEGDVYVAGQFTDEAVFGSTNGATMTKQGVNRKGAYATKLNAGFLAKYTKAGVLSAVHAFAPTDFDPADFIQGFTNMDFTETNDLSFRISKIKVYNDKVYMSALYSGHTVINPNLGLVGGVLETDFGFGDCYLYTDFGAVLSFPLTLNADECIAEQRYEMSPRNSWYMQESIHSVTFDVNEKGVYGAFTASGSVEVYRIGLKSEGLYIDSEYTETEWEEGYAFVSPEVGTNVVLRTPSSTSRFNYLTISDAMINNGKLYAVGNYAGDGTRAAYLPAPTMPNATTGVEATTKQARMFVATINLSDFKYNNAFAAPAEADALNPVVQSAAMVNDAMFINYTTYAWGQSAVSTAASAWFDGEAFSAAPTTAYGIAVSNGQWGMALLPVSTTTELSYKFATYTKEQSGLQNIAAEDADAPVEYFNLQGIRVENPANGLYIRRQGSKVEKVIL